MQWNNIEIPTISPLEEALVARPFYETSLDVGQIRSGHAEGQYGYHVQQILNHIEAKYASSPNHALLRIIGFIHDMGKLGAVDLVPKYMPLGTDGKKLSTDQRAIYETEANAFRLDFPIRGGPRAFVPKHAEYSLEFAKHFFNSSIAKANLNPNQVQDMLDVIQFHDSGWKFFKEYKKDEASRKYSNKELDLMFEETFGEQDVHWYELLLQFMDADNSRREPDTVIWLQDQLLDKGHIYDKKVKPGLE